MGFSPCYYLNSFFVLLTRFLIGFSHPKARYFLLRCQKKVSKEKATRMPLTSCASRIYQRLAKWTPVPLPTHGIHAVTLRPIPDKYSNARRGMTGIF
jgi:hypothetical protein